LTEQLIQQLGYLGISLILVLGGLGLPIPEEVPIILAAVLSRHGRMWWPFAVSACMVGVLLGDFVVYFLGYFYGEKVLKLRLTRRLLTRPREAQIKGYFHRHGFKILVLGRFAPGFRTAAYLTAGILQLPPLKLLLTDLVAAALSTSLMFGLGFYFADKIQGGIHQFQQGMVILLGTILAVWLVHRYFKARQRAGQAVGPPVQIEDELFPPPVAEVVKAAKLLDDEPDARNSGSESTPASPDESAESEASRPVDGESGDGDAGGANPRREAGNSAGKVVLTDFPLLDNFPASSARPEAEPKTDAVG
jgi:membrane protein DedA with SNARE-associated domain